MEMAVAERGLLVIDAVAHGLAGHAAREEGINAIDVALLFGFRTAETALPPLAKDFGPETDIPPGCRVADAAVPLILTTVSKLVFFKIVLVTAICYSSICSST
jgi:hypothetical protein